MGKKKTFKLKATQPRRSITREPTAREQGERRNSSAGEQSERRNLSAREQSQQSFYRDESIQRGRSLTRKDRSNERNLLERDVRQLEVERRRSSERNESVRGRSSTREYRRSQQPSEREYRRSQQPLEREYRRSQQPLEREYRRSQQPPEREYRRSQQPPEREYRRSQSLYPSEKEYRRSHSPEKEYRRSQQTPEREYRRSQQTPEREYRRSQSLYPPEKEYRRSQQPPERERSTRRTSLVPEHNKDLETISKAVIDLTKEVNHLKKKDKLVVSPGNNQRHEFSPEPEGGYRQRARTFLEDMTTEQYKSFHDEVISILNGLDESLQLDHTKNWTDISSSVARTTMKEIDKSMKGRFSYKDTELKWVLQQLHRHRRENWKNNQDPDKRKAEKRRKGINSRRGDKKERRQKGLLHLFNNNDGTFDKYQPSTLTADAFREDCEQVFNEGAYHSDEVSETDTELCEKEIEEKIRPKNKQESDKHVLHVYDKKWRSTRVRNLLRAADKTGENISHVKIVRRRWYNDTQWADSTKPPEDAPAWTISLSYNSDDTVE